MLFIEFLTTLFRGRATLEDIYIKDYETTQVTFDTVNNFRADVCKKYQTGGKRAQGREK